MPGTLQLRLKSVRIDGVEVAFCETCFDAPARTPFLRSFLQSVPVALARDEVPEVRRAIAEALAGVRSR